MTDSVLEWLRRRFPAAKNQTLKRMVQAGRVSINARPATRLSQQVLPEDQVNVDEGPSRERKSEDRSNLLSVLYEDDDLLVVNKPAGLLTSTVPREKRPTLLALVREYVAARQQRARVGLIHRLDRDASGLLVFSKSDLAYQSLKTQFFKHSVGREYRAAVRGVPREVRGRVETRLVERADGTVHSTRQAAKGARAVTAWELLKQQDGLSLLRVSLLTGRKHQIRVHLAERGMPIVGDVVYGPAAPAASRLMLAATRLVVVHPRTGKEMAFEATLPAEFPLM